MAVVEAPRTLRHSQPATDKRDSTLETSQFNQIVKQVAPRVQLRAISDLYDHVRPQQVIDTCPITIPRDGAEISHPRNNFGNVLMTAGYRMIAFSWKNDGLLYVARWHTKTSPDLEENRPTWRVSAMNVNVPEKNCMELVSCDGEKIWFPKSVYGSLLDVTHRERKFENSANTNLRSMLHFAEATIRASHFVDTKTLPRRKRVGDTCL